MFKFKVMEMRHINKPRHSIAVTGDSSGGRRLSSFLHLNIPETNWRGSLTHLHLPTFNITSADGDHTRKFNFNLGIRRHSHNVNLLFCFVLFEFFDLF